MGTLSATTGPPTREDDGDTVPTPPPPWPAPARLSPFRQGWLVRTVNVVAMCKIGDAQQVSTTTLSWRGRRCVWPSPSRWIRCGRGLPLRPGRRVHGGIRWSV